VRRVTERVQREHFDPPDLSRGNEVALSPDASIQALAGHTHVSQYKL
jgi:hypothetical protein